MFMFLTDTLYKSTLNVPSYFSYEIISWDNSSASEKAFYLQKIMVRLIISAPFRDTCQKHFNDLQKDLSKHFHYVHFTSLNISFTWNPTKNKYFKITFYTLISLKFVKPYLTERDFLKGWIITLFLIVSIVWLSTWLPLRDLRGPGLTIGTSLK